MAEATAKPVPQAASQPVKKKNRILWYVIGVFVAILVGIGAWALMSKGAVETAAKDFIAQVQAGDATAAYALTSTGFKSVTTQEQLAGIITDNWSLLPKDEPKIADFEIKAETGSAQAARVLAEWPPLTDGGRYVMLVTLTKEEGQWMIVSAETSALASSESLSLSDLPAL